MIEVLNVLGDDLMIANCARVSMNKWHDKFEPGNDDRLIKYLARNNHFTPFAAPQIQMRVTVPIFVARQWTRSNVGTTRNEVSRRYVDSHLDFYVFKQLRKRPTDNIKQGSGEDLNEDMNRLLLGSIHDATRKAVKVYHELLEAGVAPEQARAVLPQTLMTQWVETGSLAFWARFCNLRLGKHAQKEIQIEAREVSVAMEQLFPVSWAALMKNQND